MLLLLLALLPQLTLSSDCSDPLHVGILDLLTPDLAIRNIVHQLRERRVSDTQVLNFLKHTEEVICTCNADDPLPCCLAKAVRGHAPRILKNLRNSGKHSSQLFLVNTVQDLMDVISREVCLSEESVFKVYPTVVRCLKSSSHDTRVFGEKPLLELDEFVQLAFTQEAKHLWEAIRLPFCVCGWMEMVSRHSWAKVVDESNKKSGSCLSSSQTYKPVMATAPPVAVAG